MDRYKIFRQPTKNYYNIEDGDTNLLLTDNLGDTLRFDSYEDAEAFLEEWENGGRLIRPSLDMYRKRDHFKKYWWVLILAILLMTADFILVSLYINSPGLIIIFFTLGAMPLIFMNVHYEILYNKHNKAKWKNYNRWENEPEVRKVMRDSYIKSEVNYAASRSASDLPKIFKYNTDKEVLIFKDKSNIRECLVTVKISNEDYDKIVNEELKEISIEDKGILTLSAMKNKGE